MSDETGWFGRGEGDRAEKVDPVWHGEVGQIMDPMDVQPIKVRKFDTGATRDTDTGKLSYNRFFSAAVLRRRAQYMQEHRKQRDGSLREPDNWKKGIPIPVYLDSLVRHVKELELIHEGEVVMDRGPLEKYEEDTLCAILFNAEGLLFEMLNGKKGHAEPGI